MPKDTIPIMSLGEHLDELRKRLIYSLLGLLPIAIVALVFGTDLLTFLISPARDALRRQGFSSSLQATGPLETFNTYLTLSVIAALVAGAPWVLYQLWRFVAPGLYARERRYVYVLLPLSTLLTVGGVVFLFRVIMPMILAFFVSFGSTAGLAQKPGIELPPSVQLPTIPVLDADPANPQPGQEWFNLSLNERRICVAIDGDTPRILSSEYTRDVAITQQYRVSEYVSLLLMLAVAFVLAFQMPVVVLLIGWAGFVTPELLGKYRKHAILVLMVVAALVTPGDPGSMVALSVPLILLFELGIVLLRLMPPQRAHDRQDWGDDRDALDHLDPPAKP